MLTAMMWTTQSDEARSLRPAMADQHGERAPRAARGSKGPRLGETAGAGGMEHGDGGAGSMLKRELRFGRDCADEASMVSVSPSA